MIVPLKNGKLTETMNQLFRSLIEKKVVDALAPLGLLIIGSRENLPLAEKTLVVVPPFAYVFRKKF